MFGCIFLYTVYLLMAFTSIFYRTLDFRILKTLSALNYLPGKPNECWQMSLTLASDEKWMLPGSDYDWTFHNSVNSMILL